MSEVRAIRDVVQATKDVKNATKAVERAVQGLEKTIEQMEKNLDRRLRTINESVEIQTKVQKALSVINAEADLLEAEEIAAIESKVLRETELKLVSAKTDILRDFVKGILDSIKQFGNMIHAELESLKGIIKRRDRVKDFIERIDPQDDERELIQETRTLFSFRSEKSTEILKVGSENLSAFVDERKRLYKKIEDLYVNQMLPVSQELKEGDIFILTVPVPVVVYEKVDGAEKHYKSPPQVNLFEVETLNFLGIADTNTLPSRAEKINNLMPLAERTSTIVKDIHDPKIQQFIRINDIMVSSENEKLAEEIAMLEKDKIRKTAIKKFYLEDGFNA